MICSLLNLNSKFVTLTDCLTVEILVSDWIYTIPILPSDWSPVGGSHGAGLGGQHVCARALEVCLAATLRQRRWWGMTMLMFSIHLVVQLLPVETLQ